MSVFDSGGLPSEAPRLLADTYRHEKATWLALLDMYCALREYRLSLDQLVSELPSLKYAKALQRRLETLHQGRLLEELLLAFSEGSAECHEYGELMLVEIDLCEECMAYIVDEANSPTARAKWEAAPMFLYPAGNMSVLRAKALGKIDGLLECPYEFLALFETDPRMKKLAEHDEVLAAVRRARQKFEAFLKTHREYMRIRSLPLEASTG